MSKIVLFYNVMWGGELDYPLAAIPQPFVLTTDRRAIDEAVAVVFHLPELPADALHRLAKRRGQLWVAWSMECEVHHAHMRNPDVMQRFDLTMTYARSSDVWHPYFNPSYSASLRQSLVEKENGKLINAFVSSRYNQSGRIEFLLRLMAYLDVHSYGKIFRNRSVEEDCGRAFKMETIKRYKFTLALENATARDYVTEKFYDPLIAGSVPVYLGAPNIEELAPGDDCFINVADWQSPEELANYLIELASDDVRYRRLLEWKSLPLRPQFARHLEDLDEHPFVRLCRKIEERLA